MRQTAQRAAFRLAAAAVALKLAVSGNLLIWLGLSYELEGGSLAEKVHPGTYIAAAAFAARLAAEEWRPDRMFNLCRRWPDFFLFLAAMSFCLVWAACLTGAGGLITIIDTFLPAGMLAMALADARATELRRLRHLLRGLIVFNALLALAEAAAGTHLVPLPAGVREMPDDFRPTALYDHPLTGAMATMLGLFLRGPAARCTLADLACYAVLVAALPVFGGRMALAVLMCVAAGAYAWWLGSKMLRMRLALRDFMPVAAAVAVGLPAAAMAMAFGLAGRLGGHLYWDMSAQSRIDQVGVFGRLSAEQVLFGCRRADLLALIEPLRLTFGVAAIENFWLLMLATLGLLCFPIFLAGVAALARGLWRAGDARAHLMILALLLAASTSNSLGRKSILLLLLVACVAASGKGWCSRRRPQLASPEPSSLVPWRLA